MLSTAVRFAPRHSARALAPAATRPAAAGVGPGETFSGLIERLEKSGVTYGEHVATSDHAAAGKTGKCPFLADKSNAILRNSAEMESNARGYVRKFPLAIKEAKGIMLTDVNGNKYYDMLGCAGTLALGHNHPVTVDAMKKFIDSGAPLQALDLATEYKDEFIRTLRTVLPDELSRVHFASPAGTDALDAAVKMCKMATGRRSVISFHGGYHGMGQSMLSLMGNLSKKSSVPGLMPDVYFLPYPNNYRNPFGIPGEEGDRAVMHYIQTVLDDDESGIPAPACMVIEAIQGEGGANPISDWALQELRRITKERNIPLIIDEVQAGFCRSGNFFAYEKSGIVPDVVCMSKAIGGSMPMAALAFTDELDVWKPSAHTGTFRGNQMAFACGTASINYMKEVKLWEQVRAKGENAIAKLNQLKDEVNIIGNVRGRGLMIGIELVDPTKPTDHHGLPAASGQFANEVQKRCFEKGMLMETGGRADAVARVLCPLIITDEELDTCLNIFADSVRETQTKFGLN